MGKAGRWVDKNVLQNPIAGLTPAGFFYQMYSGKGLFGRHSPPPPPGTPPPPPDITDKAIQAARRNEEFRKGVGSRRNSFITGPLGDNTTIPVLGKSVITGG